MVKPKMIEDKFSKICYPEFQSCLILTLFCAFHLLPNIDVAKNDKKHILLLVRVLLLKLVWLISLLLK